MPDQLSPMPTGLADLAWYERVAVGLASTFARITRAFRAGTALVTASEESWGHQSEHIDEAWGNYIATSVAVYACVNYRAKNLAKLPLRLYRVDARGNRKEVTTGLAYELLTKVNPFWTFGRLIRMTEMARCLWGSGYWCLERGQGGRLAPQEIWWARPDHMLILPHQHDYLTGYVYENMGERIPWRHDEVIWLPMDNPIDEFAGLSPIASARLSIDLGIAGLRANKNLFDQGMSLGGIISPSDPTVRWTPEQTREREEQFARRFRGLDKQHKWAVLGGDVKATPLGVNPRDAEFINQMKWSLADVARVYNIPPELVGDHEHATYSNIDQAYQGFWSDCMEPEADEIAEDVTEQLLPLFPNNAGADLAEFDTSKIAALQEDRQAITEIAAKWWTMGVPLNKVLKEFAPNLLPEGGQGYEWGETWWAPSTLIDVSAPPPPPPEPRPAPALPPGGDEAAPEEEGDQEQPATPEEAATRALRLLRAYAQERLALPAPKPERKAVEYGSPEHERRWRKAVRTAEPAERRVADMCRDFFRRQEESVVARIRQGSRQAESQDSAATRIYLEQRAASAAVVKAQSEPFDQARWGKEFKRLLQPLIAEHLQTIGEETLIEVGSDGRFDVGRPEVVRWLEGRAQRSARQVNQTTYDALKQALGAADADSPVEDLIELVRSVYGDATANRARMIAQTEVTAASTAGQIFGARQSGNVEGKEWVSSLDEKVRDTHRAAHGQIVGLDEDFTVGDGRGPGPGQMGSAAEDANCRCYLGWLLKEESS